MNSRQRFIMACDDLVLNLSDGITQPRDVVVSIKELERLRLLVFPESGHGIVARITEKRSNAKVGDSVICSAYGEFVHIWFRHPCTELNDVRDLTFEITEQFTEEERTELFQFIARTVNAWKREAEKLDTVVKPPKAKRKKPTAPEMMSRQALKNPESMAWSLSQWADYTHKAESTIQGTDAWKSDLFVRARAIRDSKNEQQSIDRRRNGKKIEN
ncbi:hypothetical protein N9L06_05335 [Mariniblastus sp.]|nr:hypothetical protein [Mariniblastus sp.]